MTARLLRDSRKPSTFRSASAPSTSAAAISPLQVLSSLTPRDRLLVTLLSEHQVLTTSHVMHLAFPSRTMAQRRLLRLFQLRVLDRFRWHQIVGSTDWHYTLGPVGEALAAAAEGTSPPTPAAHTRRIERLATSPRLDHLLGINDAFSRLAGHARRHPGAALDEWWSEHRCAEICAPFVRPDGFGRWTDGTRKIAFFFEHDTGSEPLTKVVAKLPGYADLTTAGGPNIPVLIWLPTTRRETNLHAKLADTSTPVTVATATAELTDALGCGPAGPAWLTAPGRPRRALADLGTAPAGFPDRAAAADPRRPPAGAGGW